MVSGLFDLSRFGTLCFPGLRKIRGVAPFFHQFGQLGEQSKETVSPFGQLWGVERVFSSVWAARGAEQ